MKPDSAKEEYNLSLLNTLLEKFINMDHELIQLSKKINWVNLEKTFSKFYADVGRKGIKIRLIMGLQILQYTYSLSDEEVCRRWIENPYFQYFCGEKFFNHQMPIDLSNMS